MKTIRSSGQTIRRAARVAFPHTIPIFAGFWFLGLTYGIYMNVSGFSFVVYCLKDVSMLSGSHVLPELIAISVVVGLHLSLIISARITLPF